MKKIVFLVIFVLGLSGCMQTGILGKNSYLVVPDKINFDNEIYYSIGEKALDTYSYTVFLKQNEELENATETMRIFIGDIKNGENFKQMLQRKIKNGIEIEKLSQNKAIEINIYEPNEKYKNYQLDIDILEDKKCGLATVSYTHFFDKNTAKNEILKFAKDKKSKLIQSAPKLFCSN